MTSAHIEKITIYPLKSGQKVELEETKVELSGLKFDRKLMIVDKTFRFVTARTHPLLLKINVHRDKQRVIFHFDGENPLIVDLNKISDERLETKVWGNKMDPVFVSEIADKWLTNILGIECHLTYCDSVTNRRKKNDSDNFDVSGFFDSCPILIISVESLEDLNKRLKQPVNIDRFRTNLFITGGGKAYCEEEWKVIKIGDVLLEALEPCRRCILTTTDNFSLIRDPNREPLSTLKKYHLYKNEPAFGMNYRVIEPGYFNINDELKVLS